MKGCFTITLINKEEAASIRERFPYVHICRTCKQKSKRHRYYMAEVPAAMRYLDKMRSGR